MDKMKEGFTRGARRMRENLNYSVGLSGRKDELQSINHLEQRNQKMIAAVKGTRQNLQSCIRSGNKDDSLEKRKRRLDDAALVQQLQSDANDFAVTYKSDETPVLAEVMKLISQALDAIDTERVLTDQHIEKNIIDAFGKYLEEEKALSKMKDKLARAAVDVEVARKRKLGNHDDAKAQEMQDEYDDLQSKLDNYKDNIYTGVYTLYAKQAEIANIYKELVNAQMEYHRTALQKYENLLPEIDRKIASYPKRPVFGCHLEDHLRYSNRSIAVVLEVCCSALQGRHFNEKGLFRVNGNNNRIRRMKAAFDAHEIVGALPDSDENVADPHSLCSVLKLYLRELPEPLLTHHLHADWVRITKLDPDSRMKAVAELLPYLPEANRLNLAYLIRFLQLMLKYEKQIMMSVGNLSIVFGPNLLDSGSADSDNMCGSKLVETFLVHADTLFPNDKFDFDPASVSKSTSGFTGGFDENRVPPRATQIQVDLSQNNSNVSQGSFRRSAVSPQTPPLRSRPKCPAPPPPPPSAVPFILQQRLEALGPVSEVVGSRDEEISSSTENLSNAGCKSPSAGSSDSMYECGSSVLEIGDDVNGESSATQTVAPPSRPPPPRSARRVSSPTDLENQSFSRPVSYVNAMSSQEAIIPPPRRTATRQIGSIDENNRTVVHLETDNVQANADQKSPTTSPLSGFNSNVPIPKPRLPAKPKPSPDGSNEFTKL